MSMQFLRTKYQALFGVDIQTMLQFMWQLDVVGVAHFVMDCLDYMHSTVDGTSNQPFAAG